MTYYLVIEASGWKNGSGYTYTANQIEKYEIDNPEDHRNIDWNAVIGLDNFTPEEWEEYRSYEEEDTIWTAKLVTEDNDGGPISEELIEEVYESDIVKKWME